MSVQTDMAKAKQLRADAKSVRDPVAKQDFLEAADRVERRAAKSVKKIGRRRRRKTGGHVGDLRSLGAGGR